MCHIPRVSRVNEKSRAASGKRSPIAFRATNYSSASRWNVVRFHWSRPCGNVAPTFFAPHLNNFNKINFKFPHIIRPPVHQILYFKNFFSNKIPDASAWEPSRKRPCRFGAGRKFFFKSELSDHVVSHQVNHVICFSGEKFHLDANEACGDGALSGPQEFDALMKQLAISWKIRWKMNENFFFKFFEKRNEWLDETLWARQPTGEWFRRP